MRGIRRKEKEITDHSEILTILKETKYVTIAMTQNAEPYLVTLSHAYDEKDNCIYFHCAQEGKKNDILSKNPTIWGQAVLDHGYVQDSCDHLYASAHFKGTVTFVEDLDEKRHALEVMINALEKSPQQVIDEQITEKSLRRVGIGRIDIEYLSGKRSKEVIISL